MENIINTGSTTANLDRTAKQPRPFVLALLLTSILYFGIKSPMSNNTVAVSRSPQTTNLSESVANAVVQDLSQRSGLPKSALKIVHARQQTWSDHCLGVGDHDLLCAKTQVPGWQIIVASGEKRWVYRTNASGSLIKLDSNTAAPSGKGKKVMVALAPDAAAIAPNNSFQ